MKMTRIPFFIALNTLIFISASSQGLIKLEVGQKFQFRFVNHQTRESQYQLFDYKKQEDYHLLDVDIEVVEKYEDHYLLKAEIFPENVYSRHKSDTENWRTAFQFHKELNKESFQTIEYHFELTKKGDIIHRDIKQTKETNLSRYITNKLLSSKFHYFYSFFTPLSEKLEEGDEVFRAGEKYIVKLVDDHHVRLKGSIESNDTICSNLLFDRNGVLIERIYEKKSPENLFNRERIIRRSTFETSAKTNATIDQKKEKSIQNNHNVRIRGKITNPKEGLAIEFKKVEYVSRTQEFLNIIVPVNPDGSFELNLSLDKLTFFNLKYGESFPIFISPHDDVFIEFDKNDFLNTITSKGIGSSHLNFMLDKFRFEKEQQLTDHDFDCIADYANSNISDKEYTLYILRWYETRKAYIEQYHSLISPDVTLAVTLNDDMKFAQKFLRLPNVIIQELDNGQGGYFKKNVKSMRTSFILTMI